MIGGAHWSIVCQCITLCLSCTALPHVHGQVMVWPLGWHYGTSMNYSCTCHMATTCLSTNLFYLFPCVCVCVAVHTLNGAVYNPNWACGSYTFLFLSFITLLHVWLLYVSLRPQETNGKSTCCTYLCVRGRQTESQTATQGCTWTYTLLRQWEPCAFSVLAVSRYRWSIQTPNQSSYSILY